MFSFDGRSVKKEIARLASERADLIRENYLAKPKFGGIDSELVRRENYERIRKIEKTIDRMVAAIA